MFYVKEEFTIPPNLDLKYGLGKKDNEI